MLPNLATPYKKAIVALILCNLIWGVAGPVIKGTLNYIPPYTFLFLRCVIACIILAPILFLEIRKGVTKFPTKHFPHLFLLGFLGITVNLGLTFEGFKRTTSMEGTLLGSLGTVLTIVAGAIFLGEKLSIRAKIGVLIAVAGSILLILEPVESGGITKIAGFYGNILLLLANLSWILYVLYSKKIFNHRHHYSPLIITCFLFLTGLITFAPLSFVEYLKDPAVYATALSFPSILGVLYMGIFSSVGGYFLYGYALEKVDAGKSAVFGYLGPVFAAPVALIFLKETLSPIFLLASIVTVIGVIIMTSKNPTSEMV